MSDERKTVKFNISNPEHPIEAEITLPGTNTACIYKINGIRVDRADYLAVVESALAQTK